jgi:ABC-type multidrug transport system ATPase subunit
VTTHYMDEAEQCDRLAFILNGGLIAEGAPDDLKADLRGRIFEIEPHRDPFSALPVAHASRLLEDAYLFGVRLRIVSTDASRADAPALAAGFGAWRLTEPTLEDVFVSLARRQAAQRLEKVAS